MNRREFLKTTAALALPLHAVMKAATTTHIPIEYKAVGDQFLYCPPMIGQYDAYGIAAANGQKLQIEDFHIFHRMADLDLPWYEIQKTVYHYDFKVNMIGFGDLHACGIHALDGFPSIPSSSIWEGNLNQRLNEMKTLRRWVRYIGGQVEQAWRHRDGKAMFIIPADLSYHHVKYEHLGLLDQLKRPNQLRGVYFDRNWNYDPSDNYGSVLANVVMDRPDLFRGDPWLTA